MKPAAVLDIFKKKTTRKERKRGNTKTEHSRKKNKDKGGKTIDEDLTMTVMAPPPAAAPAPSAPQAPPTQQAAVQSHPVVGQWVQRALDFGVEKLRDEFRQMAKYTRPDMTQNAFNANCSANINETKNRYADVPCQDQNIVQLIKPPAPNDYIHANYVACPQIRFICTQGPLDHTVEDFWWMVVQQKVEEIIMLCKTIETGKYKCAQYWPLNPKEKREFKNGITVENMNGTVPLARDPDIHCTDLLVTNCGQSMKVRHLHWSEWPDRGVPPCKLTSMELLSTVRGSKLPVIVHCSAGIGRTGTIVAIEYILEKILENKSVPPMPELFKGLRDQRAYSIQTDLQYLYIHRVMLSYFLDKYRDRYSALLHPENAQKYEKFIKDYNLATGQ